MLDNFPSSIVPMLITGLVFASLASIAGFAFLLISIWDKLKSKPSLQEALKDVPTKGDLKQTEDRLRADIDEVDLRCTEEIRRMRSYNSKTSSEIFDQIRQQSTGFQEILRLHGDKLDVQSKSFNRELNELAKEVGKLSGLIEGQNKTTQG